MIEVVWAILQQDKQILLAQRSLTDCAGGTWVFPGGKIDPEDKNAISAIHRELKEEVGLEGIRFKKLSHIYLNQYSVQVFCCDKWSGTLKPACKDIIGVGWFTIEEMYALGQSLAPFIDNSLSHISYLIQHYYNHPNEWHGQWRECDENG